MHDDYNMLIFNKQVLSLYVIIIIKVPLLNNDKGSKCHHGRSNTVKDNADSYEIKN